MPLTSVHISKTSALSAFAYIAAVKSEPPRPKVVISPFLSEEIKPGKTIMSCSSKEMKSDVFL